MLENDHALRSLTGRFHVLGSRHQIHQELHLLASEVRNLATVATDVGEDDSSHSITIDRDTAEVFASHTINPHHHYQPQKPQKAPPEGGAPVNDVLRHRGTMS